MYVAENLIKLESEVKLLREKLIAAQQTVTEMGHQMDLQKTRTRQLLAGWKIKLEDSEEKIMSQAHEKDRQFTELISDLMYFEGCLKRERQEIITQMSDKDRKIRELERLVHKQQKQINALNKANEKLLGSLHEMREATEEERYNARTSDETSHQENGTHAHENESVDAVQLQVPIMSSRRPNDRRTTVHTGPTTIRQNNNDNSTKPSSPPNAHQHRVRFVDDVIDDADPPKKSFLKVEDRSTVRKISLPAYRLPTGDGTDEKIRFF